jgi:hypothetical protein
MGTRRNRRRIERDRERERSPHRKRRRPARRGEREREMRMGKPENMSCCHCCGLFVHLNAFGKYFAWMIFASCGQLESVDSVRVSNTAGLGGLYLKSLNL